MMNVLVNGNSSKAHYSQKLISNKTFCITQSYVLVIYGKVIYWDDQVTPADVGGYVILCLWLY